MAVAHIHPPLSTYFGIADTPIVPVHVSGAIFGDPIPVLDDPDLINTDAKGEALAKTLGRNLAVLIRGHGAVTVGASIEAAFIASLYLEENCRHQLFASILRKPRAYSPEETLRVRNTTWGDGGKRISRKVWNHHLAKWGLSSEGGSKRR